MTDGRVAVRRRGDAGVIARRRWFRVTARLLRPPAALADA
jgi:hypothetical protein